MTSKEQHERNLESFIEQLRTTCRDVDSFQRDEVKSYFLMMRKFFKDYVIVNNEKYESESPFLIKKIKKQKISNAFSMQ